MLVQEAASRLPQHWSWKLQLVVVEQLNWTLDAVSEICVMLKTGRVGKEAGFSGFVPAKNSVRLDTPSPSASSEPRDLSAAEPSAWPK